MRGYQAETFGTSYQYRMSNTGAHPQQSYQSLSPDWQARTSFCGQIPTGGYNSNHWRINGGYQSGNPQFIAGNGAQQGFTQNYPQNSFAQGPANTVLFQKTPLPPPYTTAANSFHHKEWSRSDTQSFMSHNLNHRTNRTQNRLSSSGPPPEYFSAVHQSNSYITANSSFRQQAVSRSWRAQPHQALVSSSGWCNTSSSSATESIPFNSSDGTKEKMIAKIVEDLQSSFSSDHSTVHYGNQCQSQVTGSEFNHHTQQAGNDSFNSQVAPLCPAQSFPETTHSQAAKGSKAANANTKDLYGSPVQPSGDASTHKMPSPLLRELLKGTSSGGSVHLSPGCVGTRAVAVVQPLLQERCHQDARHNTSPDMTKHAQMDMSHEVRKRANVSPEKSRHTTPIKSKTDDSSASGRTLLDSSAALTQNQPTEQEPAADIQAHQQVSANHQETAAEVPESQNSEEDDSVNLPETLVELSSIPTIPHTPDMIRKIIHELNTEYMDHIRKSSSRFSASTLIKSFWGGDAKAFISFFKEKLFCKINLEASCFCSEYLTEDAVIMSGVKEDDWKAVKRHRILKHDEVYTEPPYQPFWLIDNEKLDAIEKEFGLPWSLRHHPHMLGSDTDLGQDDSISEEILREVSETVLALTEQEPVDLDRAESSCSNETTSIEPAVSTESSDPCEALELKVLPREEALLIFEQAAMSTKAQPEREERSSAEAKLQEGRDVEQEGAAVSPVKQMCCLEEVKVMSPGPDTALSEACECQSETDPLEDTKMCDEEGELNSDELYVISSDCTPDSMEVGDPAEGEDSCNTQTIIYVETIDSVENRNMDGFQEVDTLIIDVGLLGCENGAPEQSDADALGKFAEPVQSSQKETRDLSPAVADGACITERETLLSLKTREPPVCLPTSHQAVKRKQEELQDGVESSNRAVKLCTQDAVSEKKKRLADAMESKRLSLKYGTAKLTLFGSSPHSTFGKTSHVFASGKRSSTKSGPPEVLSVSLSPFNRKFSEDVPTEEPSVKLQIYEKWRKSFPPTQIRYKKFKSQTFLSSSAVSPQKSDRTRSLKPPPLSKKRIYDVKMISKRGRLLPNGWKHKKGKRGTGRHTKKHTDQPNEESIILKFSVLPETFSFKDETHSTESTSAPVQDTTGHTERKSPNKTDFSEKGTWSERSEKKYHPLKRKTSNVFQEFKTKYKKLLRQEQVEDKLSENQSH